jgi:hypothetical protein
MQMRNSEDSDIVEIIVDGEIKASEYHDTAEKVLAVIKKYGRIRVLKEVKNFRGLNLDVFKDKLIFDLLKHLKDIRCAAVVSDEQWVQQLTNFLAPAYPYPVRSFKLSEIEEARTWLKSID